MTARKRHEVEVELVDEEVVKTTARIVGPSSAAQMALDDAASRRARGETVVFAKRGSVLFVADKLSIVNIH